MKIAILHDAIFTRAGGERVLLNIHKLFPDATIYTTMYDPDKTYPEFKKAKIKTTWLNRFAHNEKLFKIFFFPFGILAARSINLKGYDVVFCTTTHCAKYVKIDKKTLVINYCFTPFRLAWNPNSYRLYKNSVGLKRLILSLIIWLLKKIDFKYSKRANHYIAMTNETAQRIKDCYKFERNIDIIKPSIDTTKFSLSKKKGDFYLVVSRLEEYKKVDLVIKTFNMLGKKLKIVGNGVEKNNLKKIANSNIEFMENIDDKKLYTLYAESKALIFPQHEDYGLTPIEAYASGTPVIAYNRGGVLDTGIPFSDNEDECTMILFENQTEESLLKAINKFEELRFNSKFIINHSKNFDDKIFRKIVDEYIKNKYKLFQQSNL
tara:strand:- start:2205 stop:3335 length:1131 start_codon:yes stop_codon:yes gene_type:complete